MSGLRSTSRLGVLWLCAWLALPAAAQQTAVAESRVPELVHRALTTMPDTRHGAKVYAAQCARCHGANARGSERLAVPSLAAQHPDYLVLQLATFIEFEREDSGTHRFLAGGELAQPQTLADVTDYLASLPGAKPGRRETRRRGADPSSRGRQLYEASCASCHQSSAAGDGQHFIPSLRGQPYSYLREQLRRFSHGHRSHAPDELLAELALLTGADMEAVARYVAGLP